MPIKFDNNGIPVQDKCFRGFKTDYLIGMTKVQKLVDCIADNLKVKYNLTDEQYMNLVEIIIDEQFDNNN